MPLASGFVIACPGLTELTVVSPYPFDTQYMEPGTLFDPAGRARPAISELVTACKALPDFDILQIVHFPVFPHSLICWCGQLQCSDHRPPAEHDQALREHMKGVNDWAMCCLESPKTGYQEGERRKRTTFRAIKLTRNPLYPMFYRVSVNVEEQGVWG